MAVLQAGWPCNTSSVPDGSSVYLSYFLMLQVTHWTIYGRSTVNQVYQLETSQGPKHFTKRKLGGDHTAGHMRIELSNQH